MCNSGPHPKYAPLQFLPLQSMAIRILQFHMLQTLQSSVASLSFSLTSIHRQSLLTLPSEEFISRAQLFFCCLPYYHPGPGHQHIYLLSLCQWGVSIALKVRSNSVEGPIPIRAGYLVTPVPDNILLISLQILLSSNWWQIILKVHSHKIKWDGYLYLSKVRVTQESSYVSALTFCRVIFKKFFFLNFT